MGREITIEVKKPLSWILIFILTVILILELQLTFASPIAFGDEAFYVQAAKWSAANTEYPLWWEQLLYGIKLTKTGILKPPIWILTQAGFYLTFGFNEGITKFLAPFISFLTALAVYLLCKRIFSEKVGFFASIIIATVPSFVTYSVLFYAEIMYTFWFAMSVLLMLLSMKTKKLRYLILTGIFIGFGVLSKAPAYILIPFLFVCGLYEIIKSRRLDMAIIKKYLFLIFIVMAITLPFFLHNFYYFGIPASELSFIGDDRSSFTYEYEPKYQYSGGAIQAGTGLSVVRLGILTYLDFAYGNIWLLPLTFLCGLVLILLRRSKYDIIILLTLLIFLYIFYKSTGRAEETSRHTLGIVPIIGVVCGIYLEKITNFLKRLHDTIGTLMLTIVFILVLYLAFLNFYGNPFTGITGKLQGMYRVKAFSPYFFETCDWVKNNLPEDVVLFSLNTHPTVYNCQRQATWKAPDTTDIVASNDLDLALSRLKFDGFTHIFVQLSSLYPEQLESVYSIDFVNMLEQHPEHFEKVHTNGNDFATCLENMRQGQGCDGSIIYEINYSGL